jgi:hypothetical protein
LLTIDRYLDISISGDVQYTRCSHVWCIGLFLSWCYLNLWA